MPSKIIVTHEAAMKDKYGARWPAIVTATNQLIAADRARGITSTFVALDSAAFRQWRARVGKPHTFKQAIDHVYLLHSRPDYIAILGGSDIVPHQNLRSPLTGKRQG